MPSFHDQILDDDLWYILSIHFLRCEISSYFCEVLSPLGARNIESMWPHYGDRCWIYSPCEVRLRVRNLLLRKQCLRRIPFGEMNVSFWKINFGCASLGRYSVFVDFSRECMSHCFEWKYPGVYHSICLTRLVSFWKQMNLIHMVGIYY